MSRRDDLAIAFWGTLLALSVTARIVIEKVHR